MKCEAPREKYLNANRETTKWNEIDFLWCRLLYQQYLFILIDAFLSLSLAGPPRSCGSGCEENRVSSARVSAELDENNNK